MSVGSAGSAGETRTYEQQGGVLLLVQRTRRHGRTGNHEKDSTLSASSTQARLGLWRAPGQAEAAP